MQWLRESLNVECDMLKPLHSATKVRQRRGHHRTKQHLLLCVSSMEIFGFSVCNPQKDHSIHLAIHVNRASCLQASETISYPKRQGAGETAYEKSVHLKGGVFISVLYFPFLNFFPQDPSMTACGFPISGRIISVSGYYRGVWAASHTY